MGKDRNAPCKCGSGLKYKKCCENKRQDNAIPAMTIETRLSLIKTGMEYMDLFAEGAKPVKVKQVKLANGGDTVMLEFYAEHSKSMDIKMEMGTVAAYLSTTFKGELYQDLQPEYFGIKAFDAYDSELMYAVCSRAAAAEISKGNSLEWIKSTWFQENTSDYRLSRAKTLISELENGLRMAVHGCYEKKYGLDWWDVAIDEKIRKSVGNIYQNQFGAITSQGNVLINYTFLLDLKKIVSADWGTFKHLFSKKMNFEDQMVRLNEIRREEAHNRQISEVHLMELENIYDDLLGGIIVNHPGVTVNYMVQNWRLKIRGALIQPVKSAYTTEEFASHDIQGQLKLIERDSTDKIAYLSGVVEKLKSLKPPPSKKTKHDELLTLFDDLISLHHRRLECAQDFNLKEIERVVSGLNDLHQKMDTFSKEFLLSES